MIATGPTEPFGWAVLCGGYVSSRGYHIIEIMDKQTRQVITLDLFTLFVCVGAWAIHALLVIYTS